jgi:hypothetical protein
MLTTIVEFLPVLAALVVVACVIAWFTVRNIGNSSSARKYEASEDVGQGYKRKIFMSESELYFLNILKELEPQGIMVVPRVHLASVVSNADVPGWKNELDRIVSFGIFDQNCKLLLLADVDASPYRNSDTQEQYDKLKAICEQIGVKFLVFRADKLAAKDYILQQVLEQVKAK